MPKKGKKSHRKNNNNNSKNRSKKNRSNDEIKNDNIDVQTTTSDIEEEKNSYFLHVPPTYDDPTDAAKIISLPLSEFLEWHRKDVIKLLDHIEKYKNPEIKFDIQNPGQLTKAFRQINDDITTEELEENLKALFHRTITYYSLRFHKKFKEPGTRSFVVMIADNIRACLEKLTKVMDIKILRFHYYLASILKDSDSQKKCKEKFNLRDNLNFFPNLYERLAENLFSEY